MASEVDVCAYSSSHNVYYVKLRISGRFRTVNSQPRHTKVFIVIALIVMMFT